MVHQDLVKWLKSQLDDKEYKWLFISRETAQDYTAMIYECRESSLIKFDGYIPLQYTVRYTLTNAGKQALGIGATESNTGDALDNAILSVLKDSEPIADFEIRSLLLETYPDLSDYTMPTVYDAIQRLNKAGKIVFRNDTYMNKLYFVPVHHSTPAPQPADTATGGVVYRIVNTEGYSHIYRGNINTDANHVATFDYDHDSQVCINAINTETATLRAENARLQAELQAARERVSSYESLFTEAGEALIELVDALDNVPDELQAKIKLLKSLLDNA